MAANCKQCIDLLVDYVDGVLDTDLRAKLDGHLHDCGACEEFLESYRATTTLCKKALAREMPESLADVVVPLLSAAFVADDRLMAHVQLAKAEGKPLFPILVRACSLAHTPFQNLAVLPRNGCPIASARDAATTWLEVHQELLAALRVESPP